MEEAQEQQRRAHTLSVFEREVTHDGEFQRGYRRCAHYPELGQQGLGFCAVVAGGADSGMRITARRRQLLGPSGRPGCGVSKRACFSNGFM